MKLKCVICLGPVEPWPGGYGHGHNPDPWPAEEGERCCDRCNQQIVIPVRLWRVGALRKEVS